MSSWQPRSRLDRQIAELPHSLSARCPTDDNGGVARAIDLNADVGEGVDGDNDLFALVTSANVACGFHAGDATTMRAACDEAVRHGVVIGAHVGYRDREGFGRRVLDVAAATLEAETTEQIRVLQLCALQAGGRVAYVKPHGALYHRASVDRECATAIVSALRAIGGGLSVLAFPRSALLAQARVAGVAAVPEGFADRAYAPDGSLVPRGNTGAVLGLEDAVRQALSIARDGAVTATDATRVRVQARSLCLHGDTPGALGLARRVVAELEAAAVELRSFA
jgi:5-oxoprolinase (ATP-hydrolysing) subunit A